MAGTRVTHVLFDFDGGGLETIVATMAARFAGSDIEMSVISLSGREGQLGRATRSLLVDYVYMRPMRRVSMLLPLGLARVIRRQRADVVHLHSGSWFKGALAARLAGVPRVIFTEHGREHHDPRPRRWLDKLAGLLTDRVVGVSERLSRYMIDKVGVRPKTVRTVPNGVDSGTFTPGDPAAECWKQLSISRGSIVVGSVGRLEAVKAYERLISAFAAVARLAVGKPPVLVIWGDGSERERLTAHAASLGIADSVRLPGWTEQTVEAHRCLDVFVLTSVSEGASVSLMEAMACGAVPLVMDVGANAEILGPELASCVVPAGDVQRLSAELARVLSDDDWRMAAGERARRRVEGTYSVDAMIESYRALYQGSELKAPETPLLP